MRKFLALLVIPQLALALTGKIDASSSTIPFDDFTGTILLNDCSGRLLNICNNLGEEAAVGWASNGQTPATDSNGIKAYLDDGKCRIFSPVSFDAVDVYVQVTGSSSASSGTITGDCR